MDTLPIPDLPLLRKTLDWARAEHEKALRGERSEWNQGMWWWQGHVCGTVCCVAGYIANMTDGVDGVRLGQTLRTSTGERIRDCAQRHLGITRGEAVALFNGINDIHDLERVGRQIAARVGEEL